MKLQTSSPDRCYAHNGLRFITRASLELTLRLGERRRQGKSELLKIAYPDDVCQKKEMAKIPVDLQLVSQS